MWDWPSVGLFWVTGASERLCAFPSLGASGWQLRSRAEPRRGCSVVPERVRGGKGLLVQLAVRTCSSTSQRFVIANAGRWPFSIVPCLTGPLIPLHDCDNVQHVEPAVMLATLRSSENTSSSLSHARLAVAARCGEWGEGGCAERMQLALIANDSREGPKCTFSFLR